MRVILVVLGLCSVGLGIVGALVPGMPATVFFLIAAWAFARSSPRLHRWLHEHPGIGPYLEMARRREMPRRARILTIVAIWIGIGTSLVLLQGAGTWSRVLLLVAGLTGSLVVASMRPRVRTEPVGSIFR